MNKINWALLILSAILYALAFIETQQLWWLVFIFPVPFFFVALSIDLSFFIGYVWAFILFSFHLSGIFFSIVPLAEGSYFFRLIPSLFIVSYESLCTAVIFWFANKIIEYLCVKEKIFYRMLIWVGALWLFIYWVDSYCLWIFDIREGYFFMHPLLPLAIKPALLQLLPLLGKGLMTVLLLLLSACFVVAFKTKKKCVIVVVLILSLPWLTSWFFPAMQQSPAWITKIAVLPIMFPYSVNFETAIVVVGKQFKKILQEHPEIELIIMPESAFSCYNFSIKFFNNFWNDQHLTQFSIIFGAFRWEENSYYNSLYWIHNGIVKFFFDKRHAMIFTERVPSLFNFNFIHDLYFKTVPAINPAKNKRPVLQIMKETAFIPYICSEIFFNEWPDDEYSSIPILAICNDIWVCSFAYFSYVKTLMYLAAKFKAIQWQRNIIYVSFSQAIFFDKHGNEINLLRK
jgi:hypothetical protein